MEIKEFQPIMNKAEQIRYSKRKKLIGKLFVIAEGINENILGWMITVY